MAQRGLGRFVPHEDSLMWVPRIITKLNSIWLKTVYPFDGFGKHVSIHYSCEIRRSYAHKVRIGDRVLLDREVWLNVPLLSPDAHPAIIIGDGGNVGRRCVITAQNQIHIHENVLLAPGVFVTDHNHRYTDPKRPIAEQGITREGKIVVESNCWLGYGSMIIASRGEIVMGQGSVLGAYAVLTRSCPPYSVLAGNPATVVKQLDARSGEWRRP